jgi:hypothetical protein
VPHSSVGRESAGMLSPGVAGFGIKPAAPARLALLKLVDATRPGILKSSRRSIVMTFERHAPMRAQTFPLADGDAGTAQTVRAMCRLIEQGKKDPRIHELAAAIVRNCPPEYTPAGELAAARAIYSWGLANVRYTPDVTGKETLHAAFDVARLQIGDCDDFTVLFCSLFETIGKKTRIVTISSHPEDPKQFSHVFPEVYVCGRWIPIDAARRGSAFGKGPEHWYRRREWDCSTGDYVDVGGLQGYNQRRAMGQHPAALPQAYRVDSNPGIKRRLFSGLRGRAPMGLGHYGLGALRRLGQDSTDSSGGIDWSGITSAIQAGTTGTANIITAERASPYNLFPTTSLNQPGRPATYPYGMPGGAINPVTGLPITTPSASLFATLSPTTMLLFGLGGIALIAALARR